MSVRPSGPVRSGLYLLSSYVSVSVCVTRFSCKISCKIFCKISEREDKSCTKSCKILLCDRKPFEVCKGFLYINITHLRIDYLHLAMTRRRAIRSLQNLSFCASFPPRALQKPEIHCRIHIAASIINNCAEILVRLVLFHCGLLSSYNSPARLSAKRGTPTLWAKRRCARWGHPSTTAGAISH